MGKVKWTEKVSSNLQAIHDYIARDSKTYATREEWEL
jgi:plasmid stabilization system protein ParE